MATGSGDGADLLWKLRVKVNTPDGGLNWSLHAKGVEATVRTNFADIVNRYKSLLVSTSEIYSAIMSKDNHKKDSRIITGVVGPGLYGQSGSAPLETVYNKCDDAILCRFENEDGGGTSLAIGPVPDTIIKNQEIELPISGITDLTPAVAASAAQPVTYATEFTKLLHAIGKNCIHLQTKDHVVGGAYTWFAFVAAHVKRVTRKKTGRVFTK